MDQGNQYFIFSEYKYLGMDHRRLNHRGMSHMGGDVYGSVVLVNIR